MLTCTAGWLAGWAVAGRPLMVIFGADGIPMFRRKRLRAVV